MFPGRPSDDLSFGFRYTLESMLGERLLDQRSADQHAILSGITALGRASVEVEDAWSAALTTETLLTWAQAATKAGHIHMSRPAWLGSFELAVLIARSPSTTKLRRMGFELTVDHILQAIRSFDDLASFAIDGPVLGPFVAEHTLTAMGLELWCSAPGDLLEDVSRLSIGTAAGLVTASEATDTSSGSRRDGDVSDIIYQHLVAACRRIESDGRDDFDAFDEMAAALLGWLRRLLMLDQRVTPGDGLRSPLHMYVSAWAIVIFVRRSSDVMSPHLHDELQGWLDALTPEVIAASGTPRLLREGLTVIAEACRSAGWQSPAAALTEAAAHLQVPQPRPFPGARPGWGWMGMPKFRVYQGSHPARFYGQVDTFIQAQSEDGGAEEE